MTKKKKKILVADDDEDVVFVLKEGLRDYDIITAYDGREAWEKIKENRPSLVIIDIIMPEINGADLNRKIKKDNEIKDIAVIIITGRPNMDGLFSSSGETAVDSFLEKPFTLKHLNEELKKILN
jgi:DNA-binding NtrC family response regulator